jgi:hypothetical protein
MKHVMIAIFTVSMGFLAYVFGILITNQQLTDYQTNIAWVGCGILIFASISSIGYACVLGYREKKKKNRKIQLELENLELEKNQRENKRTY